MKPISRHFLIEVPFAMYLAAPSSLLARPQLLTRIHARYPRRF
jgi:hypothetical protein